MMDYKELIEEIRESNVDGNESIERWATAIETLLAERDAAINLLRTLSWCNGCVHFKGLEGCGIGIMEKCNEEHDHYQFRGAKMDLPEKEDAT